jgi:creatinine amidohydrolase
MGVTTVPALSELTWTEAAGLLSLRPVGLLPVGAIEAHGPHLPLDTDVAIASAMAAEGGAMLQRAGIPAVTLPPVAYGVSFVGTCFPGTSPADFRAFEAYVSSVLSNVVSQGYRAICLCNAHLEPAHVEALSSALSRIQRDSPIPLALPDKREPRWSASLSEEFRRGARHAGSYETSLMLAIRPESVRREVLEEIEPVWVDLPAALRAGATTFAEAGGVDGYFGDPAGASVQEGVALLSALGAMIFESVLEALAQPAPGQ